MLVIFEWFHLRLGDTTTWACIFVSIDQPVLYAVFAKHTVLAFWAVLRIIRQESEILTYTALCEVLIGLYFFKVRYQLVVVQNGNLRFFHLLMFSFFFFDICSPNNRVLLCLLDKLGLLLSAQSKPDSVWSQDHRLEHHFVPPIYYVSQFVIFRLFICRSILEHFGWSIILA